MKNVSGVIAGYDPGGNNSNGLAILEVMDNKPMSISISTAANAESVIRELRRYNIIGLGVDTLSCWCTGHSGWRPADLWLRKRYPAVINSIMSPNTLSGSMGINGMAVLIETAKKQNALIISETHPKVLYYALTGGRYNYKENSEEMDGFLSSRLEGVEIRTTNDHEWDAVISVLALLKGMTGEWQNDLHTLKPLDESCFVKPCGQTSYYWPES